MVSYEIESSCICYVFVTIALVQMVPQTAAILGGEKARIEDFPFIATVRTGNTDTCTGVILSEYYILTAAHCATVKPVRPEDKFRPIVIRNDMSVMVGMTSREYGKFISKYTQTKFSNPIKKVESVTIYYKYTTPIHHYYDLALLRLSEKLEFSETVKSISLSISTVQLPRNSDVTIAGWGDQVIRTGRQVETSRQDKLQRTTFKTTKCPQGYNGDLIICLERTDSHRATKGDSGGPVIYEGKLVGILFGDKEKPEMGFALNIQERNVLEWIKANAPCLEVCS